MDGAEVRVFPQLSPSKPFLHETCLPQPLTTGKTTVSEFCKLILDSSPQRDNSPNEIMRIIYADAAMRKMKESRRKTNRVATFRDIVLGGAPRVARAIREQLIAPLVYGSLFQIFVGVTVVFNVCLICLETDERLKQAFPIVFQACENVCVVIFVLDVGLRIMADFLSFWMSLWNWADLAIVLIPIAGSGSSFVTSLYVLRIFRIVRALRVFKSIILVDELQTVLLGLVSSLHGVFLVLIVVFVYSVVTAFVGVSMFGDISDVWFGTFPRAWYTVSIILSSVGWSDPYYAVMNAGQEFLGQLYFAFSVLIGAKMLMTVMNGAAWNGLKKAKEQLMVQERESEEELVAAWVDSSTSRPMRNSPLPNDICWSRQTARESPKMILTPPESMTHLYLLKELLCENKTKISRLIDRFDALSERVIQKSSSAGDGSEDART